MNTITHWINNKAYPGTSGSTSPVTNPATGEVTGQLALGSVEDARAVIDAAAAAFPAWRDTSLAKRTTILFKFRELLNERKGELAEIITAVGLAQNFAAVRALATEGIQRGHMSLHARNIASSVGATPDEVPVVAARMVADKKVRVDYAEQILAEVRAGR